MEKSTEHLPHITILTANSGGGHRAAAQSLANALEGRARVACLNLLDEHTPFPFNQLSRLYGLCVTYAPSLYHLFYRYALARSRLVATTRAVYPLIRDAIAAPLLNQHADLVISVHPLQTDVPLWALRSAGLRTPFITVVTDPVTASSAWFCPDVDLCIVATDQARELALACGLTAQQVQVIGLPIRSAFFTVRDRPKPAARARVGLAEDRPLVLLTGGGAGVGCMQSMAQALGERLAGHPARPQLAIITGHNQELRRRLKKEQWPLPVMILGFVENMADWLAATDLLVTKAGPGTLAEATCLGIPMLITGHIPGQEAGNVAWVVQNGAGVYETRPAAIAAATAELLRPDNPTLRHMAARARDLGLPDAADGIARAALSLIRPARPCNPNAPDCI